MSRLRIEHLTVYTYRRPVAFGRHRLVLRPREGHDLQVESMVLDITPAHRLVWARDVYNNCVALVTFFDEAPRLEIRSTVVVLRSPPFPSQQPSEPWHVPLPVAYDEIESPIASAYLQRSFPEDAEFVQSWLQTIPEVLQAGDAEAQLMMVCSRISQAITYERRMAKGVQSPRQTLVLRKGSCRDMATLMMDAARALGFPARFASGYLDCPASEAGRAAMHAWTEVYLPVLGWRGFDPTLAEPASLKHIVAGVSHHPRGVMPVSGRFTGTAAEFVEMNAAVQIQSIPG